MWQLVNRKSVLLGIVLMVTAVVVLVAGAGASPSGIATGEPAAEDGSGGTLPPGSPLPSGAHCATYAQQAGSDREAVPDNTAANMSVPTNVTIPPWPGFRDPANQLLVPRIDGQYTGTTDQIIVWGACKWGFGTDVIRAMAMQESSWRQDIVADYVDDPALCVGGDPVPCPTSFGLLGLKHIYRPGSWPNSQQHTAFNVDYALAYIRGCFEGWVPDNGYTSGDQWGCLGWHFSGQPDDNQAREYIRSVQRRLNERAWTRL
jgi:hypothetical protein